MYENDRNGLLSEVQYGNGGKVAYSYDEFDRLTGVKYDGETADRYTYAYGANGEAAEVIDNELGRTTRTDYDLANRPCQTELVDNVTGEILYKTGLKYNKLNNLTTFSEQVNGETHKAEYAYDRDNRVTQIAFDGGTHKVGYTYDALGRVATRVAECGDDNGKITSTYSYVSGGYGTNSTTQMVASITQKGVNFTYEYDNRGNIVSETRGNEEDGYLTTSYVYDALDQLVRVNDPHESATWVYNYDRGGNIISKVRYAYTTGSLGAALESIPYTYGDSNWKDKLTAYNNRSFTYDTIGNPLSDGVWTYEWEAGRKLKAMNDDGTTLTFKHDHNGLRTQKMVTKNGATVTTNYVLHGKLITHMTVGSDKLHFFYDAQSHLVKVSYNSIIYTYIHNLQGDIVGLLDSAGELVVEYKYDAWGRLLSTTGTLADTLGKSNPFRYRGYIYDEESGLYYLRSRYYNPEWGRFVNADNTIRPKALLSSVYAYCANNPVIRVDQTGKLYLAAALYLIALACSFVQKVDFSNTSISAYFTERIRTSSVVKERVTSYIKSIPKNETSYTKKEPIYWDCGNALKKLSMSDLDLALAVGHATEMTITVEKVDKGFFDSLVYWGDKYKVTYTVEDTYDFDEWEDTDRNAVLIWINDTFGYDMQENGTIEKYDFTCTGSYYVYAY